MSVETVGHFRISGPVTAAVVVSWKYSKRHTTNVITAFHNGIVMKSELVSKCNFFDGAIPSIEIVLNLFARNSSPQESLEPTMQDLL